MRSSRGTTTSDPEEDSQAVPEPSAPGEDDARQQSTAREHQTQVEPTQSYQSSVSAVSGNPSSSYSGSSSILSDTGPSRQRTSSGFVPHSFDHPPAQRSRLPGFKTMFDANSLTQVCPPTLKINWSYSHGGGKAS